MLKRIFCLLCTLALLMPGAAGALSLDDTLEGYLGGSYHFSVGLTLKSLQPYGDEMITMLNGALDPIRLNADLLSGSRNESAALRLTVGDEEIFTLTQNDDGNGSVLATSLLPNRTLTSDVSAMDALNSQEEAEPFDIFSAIDEAAECYTRLTDAIVPYAQEKKANYKISGIGYAKWVRLARLDAEQAAEIQPMIAEVLGCGMDDAYQAELAQMTFSKGLTVALYKLSQTGDDLAVYIKGSGKLEGGKKRTISYLWAFSNDGAKRKDSYKFELTQSPADNRVIAASLTRGTLSGEYALSGKCDLTLKAGKNQTRTVWEYALNGIDAEGARTLTGKLTTTIKTSGSGSTVTTVETIAPSLSVDIASNTLSGTVEAQTAAGKKVLNALTLKFGETANRPAAGTEAKAAETDDEEPESTAEVTLISSLDRNRNALAASVSADSDAYRVGEPPIGLTAYVPPEKTQTIDLDTLTDEARQTLLDEMAQNLAGRLLVALAALPDIALLSDNMTSEDYAAFLQLLE